MPRDVTLTTSPQGALRRRSRTRGELRRQVAVKRQRSDMGQPAVEIGPDLAADVGPALAERKILAQIGAVLGNHAFEQGEAFGACGGTVERMVALLLQLRIARAHLVDRPAGGP